MITGFVVSTIDPESFTIVKKTDENKMFENSRAIA